MYENNFPKVELKADLTKTVEKTYDDALKKPLKSSSGVVTTVLDFFHNTVLYPLQKYNLYANNKLQNYADELQNKVQTIPYENLVSPRVNILGPAIDSLKYNLDEDYIKDMFTNILISDMDNRKQNKVLPSYIEIVKQLSKEDAEFLKLFENYSTNNFALLFIRYDLSSSPNFNGRELILDENTTITLNNIIIDNLERLNLIKICEDKALSNSQIYNIGFNLSKNKYENPGFFKIRLAYNKGCLILTDLGRNFIDICLS